VRKIDAQIAAEAQRPDAAVIAEAAIAAREYLLKKQP
jgi:hypothetical protein